MRNRPEDPKIRPMVEGDLEEVMAIERSTYTLPWTEDHFRSELLNSCSRTFVACSPGRLWGYLVCQIICDEVHLLNLTVHPDFRRCGMARRLIESLIQFCRRHGARRIDLEVRRSNHPALRMYRTFGFRERAVRKGYYPDNREDGIIMELEFGDESN